MVQRLRTVRPTSARSRIFSWVLLLVLASLAAVTVTTWLLMIRATDDRMRESLRTEIAEFTTLTDAGVDPATGAPFDGINDVLRVVITYNLARPNEKFLGYVDGRFAVQSRQQAPVRLSDDTGFTSAVGSVTAPVEGSYASAAGEVLYLAVPVSLAGDSVPGVVVAAYFADQERASADETATLMLLVGGVTSVLAAVGAWFVAGRIMSPITHITATARTINETDLSGRITDARASGRGDDIGALIDTLNSMLDRIESGAAGQRRFLDDAGHELRTPITIVRGHLDVLDHRDPADIRETIALVDEELDRMNRLVADLLLLTRADQTSFVTCVLTDVDALTRSVFEKVRTLADRDWILEASATVHASLDAQRLTQALLALADNATHHTEPGGRIGIGSQLSDGDIRFWVTDTGPGIDRDEQERIFERFARGRGGTRRTEGAGLGLSIVTAIAQAHRGSVGVGSAPGHGATFTVSIPLTNSTPAQKDRPWPAF